MDWIRRSADMTDIKTNYADLLNRLSEMQRSPYYATACHTLVQAEMVIVNLEIELTKLQREKALEQQCKVPFRT
jgi:uncharacterized protein (UPF0210 family)